MKRYASHFLFLPGYGYLKQYAVEMKEGCVVGIFPLSEEIENTEWMPGVIALLRSEQVEETVLFEESAPLLSSVPSDIERLLSDLTPYLFFPFDFTTMQPVSGTRHRLLR